MSLEQSLDAHTEAINRLIARLDAESLMKTVRAPLPSQSDIQQAEKPAPPPPPPDTSGQLEQLKRLVIRISKEKGGEATRQALGKFGVARAQELDASMHQAAIDHISSILDGE